MIFYDPIRRTFLKLLILPSLCYICMILNLLRSHQADLFGSWGGGGCVRTQRTPLPTGLYLSFINMRESLQEGLSVYSETMSISSFKTQHKKWQMSFSVAIIMQSSFQNYVTYDAKLQLFQFKFLHHILYSNVILLKIRYTSSPACSFCLQAYEKIIHFFCECDISKTFWHD